jgi:hypothetical protein
MERDGGEKGIRVWRRRNVQDFGALVGEVREAADSAACYDLYGVRY